MQSYKNNLRLLRLNGGFAAAALLSLVVLLTPAQLFKPGSAPFLERDDRLEGSKIFELLNVYSVVRKRMTDASDSSVWAVSKTILEESRRHALDPLLVVALINVESGFQLRAASADGARGLMQIQPFSAKAIAEQRRSVYQKDKHVSGGDPDLDNPIVNIKLGVFYLHSLRQSFSDLKVALAAYNQGPTQVKNLLVEEEDVPSDYAMKVLSTYHGYRKGARDR
jgi:soluble lytic murein transglycosylase-like protein